MKKIYLDYAGTTPIDPRVMRTVFKHMKESWGNASSVHVIGRKAKKVIDDSRKSVAKILGVKSEEIVFTGSGTESANMAIFGAARSYKKFGNHIITTKIEHHAVLRACQYLEKNEGFKVTYLDVGRNGIVNPESVRKALRSDTILVSIMYANNEIGTIQPVAEIAKILNQFRQQKLETGNWKLETGVEKFPLFHTDACQAVGALNINPNYLDVGLISLNGSKIYGPKGMGCLYVRRGINLTPLIVGGSQEGGMRAGTENPALIAGFAKALEIADKDKVKEGRRLSQLRDYAIGRILKTIQGSQLNGDTKKRLPNNINISFEGIDGEMLMLALDQKDIQISTGSACTSAATGPSHVMQAIKNPQNRGNIRITLGRQTKKSDLNYFIEVLVSEVKRLRGISTI